MHNGDKRRFPVAIYANDNVCMVCYTIHQSNTPYKDQTNFRGYV